MNAKAENTLYEMQELIIHNVNPPRGEALDKAWWIDSNTSISTTKSTYQIVRSKKKLYWCKYIWMKRLSNNIAIFM